MRVNTRIAPPRPTRGPGRLLMVIPGNVNFFYNLYARWMAEGFRRLGTHVDLTELPDVPDGSYDLCILSSLSGILHSVGQNEGRRLITRLRGSVGVMINLFAECARTHWFHAIVDPGRDLGINDLVDVGFLDQYDVVAQHGFRYHHVFDGLLDAQARAGPDPSGRAGRDGRIIPWAHIGMHTKGRVALTDQLVTRVASHGFVYLPEVSPIKEKGSPHLNPEQMRRVLQRTAYYVWCAHHDHFYMESLRFKTAWETGCVPIKVVEDEAPLPADLPFAAFVVRQSQVTDLINGMDFAVARQALVDEYLRRPRFESGLAKLLDAYDIPRLDLPFLESTLNAPFRAPRVA